MHLSRVSGELLSIFVWPLLLIFPHCHTHREEAALLEKNGDSKNEREGLGEGGEEKTKKQHCWLNK